MGSAGSQLQVGIKFYFIFFVARYKFDKWLPFIVAEDGKFVGDPDVGEFWGLFGGYAPIPRDTPPSLQKQPDIASTKLFW